MVGQAHPGHHNKVFGPSLALPSLPYINDALMPQNTGILTRKKSHTYFQILHKHQHYLLVGAWFPNSIKLAGSNQVEVKTALTVGRWDEPLHFQWSFPTAAASLPHCDRHGEV